MGYAPRTRNVTVGHEVVSEHIIRVPLPLPLPDLKVVNAYVIVAPEGLTLIDPGWSYEPSETVLRTTLSTLGAHLRMCAESWLPINIGTTIHWLSSGVTPSGWN
ncbi:Uncharacterised protein [Mycobacteroides abscessus subsp. massiliense]|nr:Uncharacterised protein [Mycobacteroides abscessus subsp. massiliense]